MSAFIKVVTGGSPREMGHDVGRATAGILRELLADNPAFFRRQTKKEFSFLRRQAWQGFFPFVRRLYPDYVEELRGLAEGGGVAFEDLFVISAEEELLDRWGGWDKCSSAAVRGRDGLYLIHNEDYIGRYESRLVLIDAAPKGRPAFLSLGYPGTLAGSSCGLNDRGLAMSGNSLRFLPRRRGIPKNFVLRDVLAAKGLGQAFKMMTVQPRLAGNNVMVVSSGEDRAAYIEAAPRRTVLVELGPARHLAHTNHILSLDSDRRGESPSKRSYRRLAGLNALLSRRRAPPSAADLKKIMSTPEFGLCYHGRGAETPTTLASIVMDPQRRRMFVATRAGAAARYLEHRITAR